MALPVYEIEVSEGTTYRLTVRPMVVDAQGVRAPFDLTGCTVALRVETSDEPNQIGQVTISGGYIHLYFSPAETATLTQTARTYYGIDMTQADGDIRRLLEGPVTVRRLGGQVI